MILSSMEISWFTNGELSSDVISSDLTIKILFESAFYFILWVLKVISGTTIS